MSSWTPPSCLLQEVVIPQRELYGPGPSTMPASIGLAQKSPLLGHLHPEFLKIMHDVREGLQYIFKTKNPYTFAISGTGHAGMEAALLNLLERGEKLLVINSGIWGTRAADLGRRLSFDVKEVMIPHGAAVEKEVFEAEVAAFRPAVVFVCHGESSTGVVQPLYGLGEICQKHKCLLLVDTVASLGGAPFEMDDLKIDCVYSATQKVLNAPPGLSPISFSQAAIEKIRQRKERVPSFYFDALELGNYWGCDGQPTRYHHTAPISSVYALREALAIICKRGIDDLIKQHEVNKEALHAQLAAAGIQLFVEKPEWRLPCLHTVIVPEGVDWKAVQATLFSKGIEVAGGLGATLGKIFRIGTFGANSEPEKAKKIIAEFIEVLKSQSEL